MLHGCVLFFSNYLSERHIVIVMVCCCLSSYMHARAYLGELQFAKVHALALPRRVFTKCTVMSAIAAKWQSITVCRLHFCVTIESVPTRNASDHAHANCVTSACLANLQMKISEVNTILTWLSRWDAWLPSRTRHRCATKTVRSTIV